VCCGESSEWFSESGKSCESDALSLASLMSPVNLVNIVSLRGDIPVGLASPVSLHDDSEEPAAVLWKPERKLQLSCRSTSSQFPDWL